MRGVLAAHLHVLVLAVAIHVATGIVQECSACRCISKTLTDRLAAETPKDPLDLRNRLDSQGNRYGKVIEFRLSEQRVHDLLDGLCTAVSKGNQLYTVSLNGKASVTWGDSIKSGENETWTTPSAGENEGRQKELENYCVRVMDDVEEDLMEVLKEEAGDLEDILCRRLVRACKASDALPRDAEPNSEL